MELYVTTSLKHCIFTYKKAQIIKKLKILYKLLRFDEKYTLSKSLGKKKKITHLLFRKYLLPLPSIPLSKRQTIRLNNFKSRRMD